MQSRTTRTTAAADGRRWITRSAAQSTAPHQRGPDRAVARILVFGQNRPRCACRQLGPTVARDANRSAGRCKHESGHDGLQPGTAAAGVNQPSDAARGDRPRPALAPRRASRACYRLPSFARGTEERRPPGRIPAPAWAAHPQTHRSQRRGGRSPRLGGEASVIDRTAPMDDQRQRDAECGNAQRRCRFEAEGAASAATSPGSELATAPWEPVIALATSASSDVATRCYRAATIGIVRGRSWRTTLWSP